MLQWHRLPGEQELWPKCVEHLNKWQTHAQFCSVVSTWCLLLLVSAGPSWRIRFYRYWSLNAGISLQQAAGSSLVKYLP